MVQLDRLTNEQTQIEKSLTEEDPIKTSTAQNLFSILGQVFKLPGNVLKILIFGISVAMLSVGLIVTSWDLSVTNKETVVTDNKNTATKLGEVSFKNAPNIFPEFIDSIQKYKPNGTIFCFGLEDVFAFGRSLTVFLTKESINDDFILFLIGQTGDLSAKTELVKYADKSYLALLGLGILRDHDALEKIYHSVNLTNTDIEISRYRDFAYNILKVVRTKEIINQLLEDANTDSNYLVDLLLISGRRSLYKQTDRELVKLFESNIDTKGKEINEIKKWWEIHRSTWETPKKRIFIEPRTPFLGEVPPDIIYVEI